RAQSARGASRARRHRRRCPCLFRPFLWHHLRRAPGCAGDRRLWRRTGGGGRPRQSRRHAIPSREEPGDGVAPHRQFPQLAALSMARAVTTSVEALSAFRGTDLPDLCDASDAAIAEGGGFGWVQAPPRDIMESYWRGVLLVPERRLFVARLDGTICGSAQLVHPARNNEAQAFAATLMHNFIAAWARGHGLARRVVVAVEEGAREAGFAILNL